MGDWILLGVLQNEVVTTCVTKLYGDDDNETMFLTLSISLVGLLNFVYTVRKLLLR